MESIVNEIVCYFESGEVYNTNLYKLIVIVSSNIIKF